MNHRGHKGHRGIH